MNLLPWLAKIDLDFGAHGPGPGARPPSQLLTTALVIIAAALFLITLVILWAVFIRKPREIKQHPGARTNTSSPAMTETDDGRWRVRKKHRRRRRDHRARNPTLAQTGGLSDGSTPSPPTAS